MLIDHEDSSEILRGVIDFLKTRSDEAVTFMKTSTPGGPDHKLYQREVICYKAIFNLIEDGVKKAFKEKQDRQAEEASKNIEGFGTF